MNPFRPIRDPEAVVEIDFPWKSPPLSLNKRLHWSVESKHKQAIRETIWFCLKERKVRRPAEHVEIGLNWIPSRKGDYDTDNPVPTLKVIVDALKPQADAYRDKRGRIVGGALGYGLILDDTPRETTRPEIAIHPSNGIGRCWVELRIWYPTPEGIPST